VNLIGRIDSILNDTKARINVNDFEDCAISLLTPEYIGLVPVTGGTDHGLDAEVRAPNGQTIGFVITSSRTWEGAKNSLRASLRSARRHNLPVQHVVIANLAEMNRQRRIKLAAVANEFDCELIQIYDRAWFANMLLRDPSWRQKLLSVPGGAFSLSKWPTGARPGERASLNVGRDELLASIEATKQDIILWGVPGVMLRARYQAPYFSSPTLLLKGS
jgi:hypothetical protein